MSPENDIPLGSLVDATHGTVHVTTALNTHGRTQTATVWGGEFILGQVHGHGMTTFTLPGGLSCPAPHRANTVAPDRRTRPKPTKRVLWSSDDHGQYTTRGQNSVATVLGTVWETVDTCSGTLTYVKRGRVRVFDLHDHHTVIVTAGHHFLARS